MIIGPALSRFLSCPIPSAVLIEQLMSSAITETNLHRSTSGIRNYRSGSIWYELYLKCTPFVTEVYLSPDLYVPVFYMPSEFYFSR